MLSQAACSQVHGTSAAWPCASCRWCSVRPGSLGGARRWRRAHPKQPLDGPDGCRTHQHSSSGLKSTTAGCRGGSLAWIAPGGVLHQKVNKRPHSEVNKSGTADTALKHPAPLDLKWGSTPWLLAGSACAAAAPPPRAELANEFLVEQVRACTLNAKVRSLSACAYIHDTCTWVLVHVDEDR